MCINHFLNSVYSVIIANILLFITSKLLSQLLVLVKNSDDNGNLIIIMEFLKVSRYLYNKLRYIYVS